eukprot:13798203-Heterocapsa_arctica.AAC.1
MTRTEALATIKEEKSFTYTNIMSQSKRLSDLGAMRMTRTEALDTIKKDKSLPDLGAMRMTRTKALATIEEEESHTE